MVLHAYEEWGLDAFPRLNGMFALALIDERRDELVLTRDRFGIKPLLKTTGARSAFDPTPWRWCEVGCREGKSMSPLFGVHRPALPAASAHGPKGFRTARCPGPQWYAGVMGPKAVSSGWPRLREVQIRTPKRPS